MLWLSSYKTDVCMASYCVLHVQTTDDYTVRFSYSSYIKFHAFNYTSSHYGQLCIANKLKQLPPPIA